MNHLQIILITDIHKGDSFYKKDPRGHIFFINNNSIIEPSRENGFTYLDKIESLSKKFKRAICFYAVKYEILFGVQE